MQPVHVQATCDFNFVRLLDVYKQMKIDRQIAYLLVILMIMILFSYGIGFIALIFTIAICIGTMMYLVVQQERIISDMQKSLYDICLRSIRESNEEQSQDSHDQD